MAYQIGFDMYESATQQFLQRVQSALRSIAPIPALLPDITAKPQTKVPVQESTPDIPKEKDS